MTDLELEAELSRLSFAERRATRDVVTAIKTALDRRLWLERGYSGPVAWLAREYGFSEPAAQRRLQAARALAFAPSISDDLASGKINLTSLSAAQSFFYREEKRTGIKLSPDRKRGVIESLVNKTTCEAQRILAQEFPETVLRKESLRPVGADDWSLTIALTGPQMALLERSKELLSHVIRAQSWADVIACLAQAYIHQKDPQTRYERRRQAGDSPAKRRVKKSPLSRPVRDQVIARAGSSCEFVDPQSGRRCASRIRLEVDHVVPRALGGGDDPDNLRCLCAAHNASAAEKLLGREWANAWRRSSSPSAPTATHK